MPSTTLSPAAIVPKLFLYHVHWRARSYHAGATLTRHAGSGSDFAGFSSLLACPDPRRIDVRASVRAVPPQWLVRTYLERAAIPVVAVVDVSASMRFGRPQMHTSAQDAQHPFKQHQAIQQQVTQLVAAIAWSATRHGDSFAMLAANHTLQPAWQMLPGYQPAAAFEAASRAQRWWQQSAQPAADTLQESAAAMPQAIKAIGPSRALVFLISDFYWPDDLLQATLAAAKGHDVVPLVLQDQSAFEDLPGFGWARLRDMEGAGERSWLLRPALHRQIRATAAQQRQQLQARLQGAGTRPPLWLKPDWQAEQLSRHLMETAAC